MYVCELVTCAWNWSKSSDVTITSLCYSSHTYTHGNSHSHNPPLCSSVCLSSCNSKYTRKQVKDLNICWNHIIRRMSDYSRSESVRVVIYWFRRLKFMHHTQLYKMKFCKYLVLTDNFRDLFGMFLMLFWWCWWLYENDIQLWIMCTWSSQ